MEQIKNNRLIMIPITVAVLSIILLILVFASRQNKGINNGSTTQLTVTPYDQSPHGETPTPAVQQSKEYQDSVIKSFEDSKEPMMRSSYVGALLEVVPYEGQNFKFEYSYDTLDYIVTFNKVQAAQGNIEFDQFLKDHGVESRSWITHLLIKEQ